MTPPKFNVDFSLAIRNRTGKYIIGKELLSDQADLIGRTYYWRIPLRNPPAKLLGRLLDIATNLELRFRRRWGDRSLPQVKKGGRTLHLDPYTVTMADVTARDVILVHDIGPATHPDLFDESVQQLYDRAFRRAARADARLVFVSEASRNGYIAAYGRVSDMRVIYPPIRAAATQRAREPVPGVDRPFLLTVGSLGRRKNQRLCIEAFARSGLAHDGYQYVLCGAREPGAGEVEAYARGTPGISLLPYIPDAQLAWLYANTKGFVLMSVLEGFGMPVAEAILSGAVPLVSANSVLEEVAGEQALAAPHNDVDAIARGMRSLIEMSPSERAARRVGLLERVKSFSRARFSEEWRQVLVS